MQCIYMQGKWDNCLDFWLLSTSVVEMSLNFNWIIACGEDPITILFCINELTLPFRFSSFKFITYFNALWYITFCKHQLFLFLSFFLSFSFIFLHFGPVLESPNPKVGFTLLSYIKLIKYQLQLKNEKKKKKRKRKGKKEEGKRTWFGKIMIDMVGSS